MSLRILCMLDIAKVVQIRCALTAGFMASGRHSGLYFKVLSILKYFNLMDLALNEV